MDHGTILSEGSPSELIAHLGLPSVVELTFEGSAPDPTAFATSLAMPVEARNEVWEIPTGDPKSALPAILGVAEAQAVPFLQIHVRRATLEDVFLHRTGRSLRE